MQRIQLKVDTIETAQHVTKQVNTDEIQRNWIRFRNQMVSKINDLVDFCEIPTLPQCSDGPAICSLMKVRSTENKPYRWNSNSKSFTSTKYSNIFTEACSCWKKSHTKCITHLFYNSIYYPRLPKLQFIKKFTLF